MGNARASKPCLHMQASFTVYLHNNNADPKLIGRIAQLSKALCVPCEGCGCLTQQNWCLQLKATAEKLAFLRQVAIFEGSNSRQLTQLHFVLEKCTVQRGHVIIMEGQPCAGMFFIVTGQVNILARKPSLPSAGVVDDETEVVPDASHELHSAHLNHGATSAWWGLAGLDRQATGGACSLEQLLHAVNVGPHPVKLSSQELYWQALCFELSCH